MTEFEKPFLIDTNILIYSHDKTADKIKYQKAKEFIARKTLSKECHVSAQNLAEFYYVFTSKLQKTVSSFQARTMLQLFVDSFSVIQYSAPTVLEAANIQSLYKIHFWDALLAATMKENNIQLIYTENLKDFKKIPEIEAINPLEHQSSD